jgi:hypothetical protein
LQNLFERFQKAPQTAKQTVTACGSAGKGGHISKNHSLTKMVVSE